MGENEIGSRMCAEDVSTMSYARYVGVHGYRVVQAVERAEKLQAQNYPHCDRYKSDPGTRVSIWCIY